MAELARLLLSPKRLVILIMAAVINLALFSGYCRDKQEQSIAKYSTGMQSAASAKSRENQKLQQYLEKDYPDYLKYVEEQAAAQSILSGLTKQSGFIDRNLKKTAADYSRLEGITLKAGEYQLSFDAAGADSEFPVVVRSGKALLFEGTASAGTDGVHFEETFTVDAASEDAELAFLLGGKDSYSVTLRNIALVRVG